MNSTQIFLSLFSSSDFNSISLPESISATSLQALSAGQIEGMLPAAFLIKLCGEEHPLSRQAENLFILAHTLPETAPVADFFSKALAGIHNEFSHIAEHDPSFKQAVTSALEYSDPEKHDLTDADTERDVFWSVFFPEAEGILQNKGRRIKELRRKRTVEVLRVNRNPITNPGNELIFTSNIILTLPKADSDPIEWDLPHPLRQKIKAAMTEEQRYFYDHPIQIGTLPENNEILYGLNGLNQTVKWEKQQGNMDKDNKLTCILSVSVTHTGLQGIAKEYIHHEIKKYGSFEHLDIYVFTETDTKEIISSVLIPALSLAHPEAIDKIHTNIIKLEKVFGVNGEYGRHYSFLKAASAFWQVFIDTGKRGTFKIDLDQIFPESELKSQTGKSAFEHFTTPLWGATGKDFFGNKVHLGMIAGALVNERDISKGIYTPDVRFEDSMKGTPEQRIFYSKLMMGFSTEAELMTRYGENGIDGETKCIQRIHVTGGTNGILTNYLRAYRPFTPSFIGRAEDQCYILSVLARPGTKLAYLHEDGLIMRHDKETFASDAIKAASFGSTIGDYIRTLYFTKYVEMLTNGNPGRIKKIIDPFTGCFVSRLPVTIVYLRFALKALEISQKEGLEHGTAFLLQGIKRIDSAFTFTKGKRSPFERELSLEKEGWDLFYDILDDFESFSSKEKTAVEELKQTAEVILTNCRV